MIGEQLGEYRILARLGSGGFGVVYLAEDVRRYGERVALKVLGEQMRGSPAGLKRFARELTVLQQIAHPRIVAPLCELRDDGERSYFAMELVAGRNLAEVLLELGRLEPSEALRIVCDALEGLAAAHQNGVLHRDVKCANLLVDAQGQVRLCDFGLARAVDQVRQTMSQTLLGTPAYASPEQSRGLDARVESDLYSMGVVLYELLTGTLPFKAETPVALLRLHLEAEPDPPSRRRPGMPEELDAVVLKALSKEPMQRYESAEAMREALEEVRAQLPPPAQAMSMVPLIERANRALEQNVQKNRVRRSAGIGVWVGAGLLVAAFAYGLLRVAERIEVDPSERDLAPVTSAELAAPRMEVTLAGERVFVGRFSYRGDRVRIVSEDGVVTEAPRKLLVRTRQLGPAPVAPLESSRAAEVESGRR